MEGGEIRGGGVEGWDDERSFICETDQTRLNISRNKKCIIHMTKASKKQFTSKYFTYSWFPLKTDNSQKPYITKTESMRSTPFEKES